MNLDYSRQAGTAPKITNAPQTSKSISQIYQTVKAGILLSLLAQPFEVLRTTQVTNELKQKDISFRALHELFLHIREREGYRGFFRGSLLAILKNASNYFLFFFGLENLKNGVFLRQLFHTDQKSSTEGEDKTVYQSQDLALNFLSASLSRFATTLIISPLIVLKTRFEIVGMNDYKGILDAARQVQSQEGVRGFYRGIVPTLLRDVPWSGLQFCLYEALLTVFRVRTRAVQESEQNLASSTIAFCGAASSVLALMAVYPFDNLRVRYQVNRGASLHLVQSLRQVYREEGLRGFYKGYLPRLLKKGASGAVIWSIYENIKKDFD